MTVAVVDNVDFHPFTCAGVTALVGGLEINADFGTNGSVGDVNGVRTRVLYAAAAAEELVALLQGGGGADVVRCDFDAHWEFALIDGDDGVIRDRATVDLPIEWWGSGVQDFELRAGGDEMSGSVLGLEGHGDELNHWAGALDPLGVAGVVVAPAECFARISCHGAAMVVQPCLELGLVAATVTFHTLVLRWCDQRWQTDWSVLADGENHRVGGCQASGVGHRKGNRTHTWSCVGENWEQAGREWSSDRLCSVRPDESTDVSVDIIGEAAVELDSHGTGGADHDGWLAESWIRTVRAGVGDRGIARCQEYDLRRSCEAAQR